MLYEKAYAKVNLGLQVTKKRVDGYHDLKMIMSSIDLYDELYFEDSDVIQIYCHPEVCPTHDNLVYKTVELMQKLFMTKKGVKITITKNIRVGAGLAGGSSDAAATIRGLNVLWQLHLDYNQMRKIAEKIGSDVPFCIQGIPSIVEGRGEIITPLDIELNTYLVLIFPNYVSYTVDVFKNFIITNDDDRYEKLYDAIINKKVDLIPKRLFNDLEDKVDETAKGNGYIGVKEIKNNLIKCGCNGAIMTGSGSTVIGMVQNQELANQISLNLKNIYPNFNVKISRIM